MGNMEQGDEKEMNCSNTEDENAAAQGHVMVI